MKLTQPRELTGDRAGGLASRLTVQAVRGFVGESHYLLWMALTRRFKLEALGR